MNKLFEACASKCCCTIREKTVLKKENIKDKNEFSNTKSTDTRDTELESPISIT